MQRSDEKYTPAGVLRFQPALALFSYPFFFSVTWTLIFFLSWHKREQYYIWASQAFESHSRFTASRLIVVYICKVAGTVAFLYSFKFRARLISLTFFR